VRERRLSRQRAPAVSVHDGPRFVSISVATRSLWSKGRHAARIRARLIATGGRRARATCRVKIRPRASPRNSRVGESSCRERGQFDAHSVQKVCVTISESDDQTGFGEVTHRRWTRSRGEKWTSDESPVGESLCAFYAEYLISSLESSGWKLRGVGGSGRPAGRPIDVVMSSTFAKNYR